MNASNIGTPTIASRGFVPLAVEAGITQTIAALVSGLAVDARTLLLALKAALSDVNDPLAAALNMDNLAAIIAYMERAGLGVIAASSLPVSRLPVLLDQDGPASVTAARDGSQPTQINVTFSAPPDGYTYELYLDGVFQKAGNNTASNGWVNDAISDVPADAQPHTARVLFVDPNGDQTRFGPIASFT